MSWQTVFDVLGILDEDIQLDGILLREKRRLMCTLARAIDLIEYEREQCEGHIDAMQYAVTLGEDGGLLNLYNILRMHQLCFPYGGHFRDSSVIIYNAQFEVPPPPISPLVDRWVDNWRRMCDNVNYAGIAMLHIQFERIHPFPDGNGRVGRMLINYMCAYAGLPLVSIRDKGRYFTHLKKQDATGLAKLFKESMI